ncbi:hypothetical protein SAMN04487957_10917 [Halomonas shengliensis]|uniref:Uncharacterized protein n=1 Tax=Halomonas shengliensis TaxID=419597 RepID=A0A1H0L5H7_9GAMM|nr:hypothetical protein [Halomonas shengliensis]SDO63253.1 hypothetical protein SAMN04487957_10917 [Halomonas shengliensis]
MNIDYELKLQILLRDLHAIDYEGLDPSTIRFSPLVLRLAGKESNTIYAKLRRSIVYRSLTYFGHRLAPEKWAPKARLPKCLALAALANMLHDESKVSQERARWLLSELNKERLKDKFTWSHGFPYSIQGAEILAKTPNLVTTYFCYLAYHTAEYCGVKDLPDEVNWKKIAINSLSVFPTRVYNDLPFYMYTPNSGYFVHNANLMAVEMGAALKACGNCIPNEVEGALLHSIEHFEKSESFPYSAPPSKNITEDNYHTGYVLRSLDRIKKFDAYPQYAERIDKILRMGCRRYVDMFIKNNKVMRDSQSIDTHSLAESLLFLDRFRGMLSTEQVEKLEKAIECTNQKLWDKKSKKYKNKLLLIPKTKIAVTDKTSYPRWSQAWMAFAYAQSLAPVSRKML